MAILIIYLNIFLFHIVLSEQLWARETVLGGTKYSRLLSDQISRSDAAASLSLTQDRYPTAYNYILETAGNQTIIDLTGDGRADILGSLIKVITSLVDVTDEVSNKHADEFVKGLIQMLDEQTSLNPYWYVSHGSDHSLRVGETSKALYEALSEVQTGLEDTYWVDPLPEGCVDFAILLGGICHDLGYVDLGNQRVPKFLHAKAGSIMFENLLNVGENVGGILLEKCGGSKLLPDLVASIATHNYDKQLCRWKNGPDFEDECEYSMDDSTPESGTTPLLKPQPGTSVTYVREYTPASTTNLTFTWLARVADNMDATFYRLSTLQRKREMQTFWQRLYLDAGIRDALSAYAASKTTGNADWISGNKTELSAARSEAVDVALAENGELMAFLEMMSEDDPDKEKLRQILRHSNEVSWLHFFSNFVLDKLQIFANGNTASLHATFQDDLSGDFFPEGMTISKWPGPAFYQINRMAEAMGSVYFDDGGSVLDNVEVHLKYASGDKLEIAGLSESDAYPLKAFTQANYYNENGEQGKMCEPHCSITEFLTYSPEVDNSECVNRDGESAPCAQGIDSALTYHESRPTGKPTSKPNKEHADVIVISIIAVGVLIFVGCGIKYYIGDKDTTREAQMSYVMMEDNQANVNFVT